MLLMCFLTLSEATAQSKLYRHPTTLGIHFVLNDFAHKNFSTELSAMDAGLGLNYLHGITSRLDYVIYFTGSFPDSISEKLHMQNRSLMLQGDIGLRARIFNQPKTIEPFVLSGLGLFYHQDHAGPYGLLGTGLVLNFKEIYLHASVQYRPSLTNYINSHFYYSISLAGIVAKSKKKKPVAAVPASQTSLILDRDGDGIPDIEDRCPDKPGLAQFKGCPDSDKDGIEDEHDRCPTIAGLARYQGCPIPDQDRDGVNDEEDSCTAIPGSRKYYGCPVPDTDGDGVNDESDNCLTVPGPEFNKGCPVTGIQEKLEFAAERILFHSGSARLMPSSYSHLDTVAGWIKDLPGVRLIIEGHTDGDGNRASNQILSEERAKAVKNYLLSKGVDASSVITIGYGEDRPIKTNETAEGRAANRRVELQIEFNSDNHNSQQP